MAQICPLKLVNFSEFRGLERYPSRPEFLGLHETFLEQHLTTILESEVETDSERW